MILYMFERKLNKILFNIQYYGPGWYDKNLRPYVDRYFMDYVRRYLDYTAEWSLWVQFLVMPILFLLILYWLPTVIKLLIITVKLFITAIIVTVYPYCVFVFTVFYDIFGPIISFFKWLIYYPTLLLNFLGDFLHSIGKWWRWLVHKVVEDGVIASIKFIYFFIINGIREIYLLIVVSESGWLHFLAPNFEFLINCTLFVYSWLRKNWWFLLKYYILYRILRKFYRWYAYKVPNMDIEWFVDRGPTMLFIYQLRVCPFKEVWALYKEKFYDFVFGSLMFIGYIFQMQILDFLKRHIRNVDGCRLTTKRRIKRKFRRPIFRFLIKLNLFFLPFYYLVSFGLFYSFTFIRIAVYAFSKLLLVVAVLLFIVFLWLNFHKLFFDYFIFFVLNKLGFRFPRSTLYTQSVKSRASDFRPISRKLNSSLVQLRLNSLVDLKNTNIYSVYLNKLFNQLPIGSRATNNLPKEYIRTSLFRYLHLYRKKHQSRKYGYASIGYTEPGLSYSPLFETAPFSGKSRVEIKLRFSRPNVSRHFNLVDKFNLLQYSSSMRYARLKGSVFLPKFISNKFDVNTFVLKELLMICSNNGTSSLSSGINGYSVSNVKGNLEFFSPKKNLSVPNLDLFGKSDFFFFDKNFNKVSSNRKSNLLSDLCYSFLGRFNFPLSTNSTLFYSTPIYRHRTGGNFRYKNVYSYDQRSIINSVKFLDNFKILASFPRKRIRVYNPNNVRNRRAGGLLKRHLKFNRIPRRLKTNRQFMRLYRSIPRIMNLENGRRLIRQFAAIKLKRRRKIDFDYMDLVVAPRRGSRYQRKFFYKRFIYNRFNKKFSFYKKRQKVFFNKSFKNPKIAFLLKPKFSASKGRMVSTAVISRSASMSNRFNFLSFTAKLKTFRRNIIFLLKYKNRRKFFKHGTKFLVRSQVFSKKGQINKGRKLRRFFSRSNVYLSFLKSVYFRNVRLLLAVKAISSAIKDSASTNNNGEVHYLPLFRVLEKPWWHITSLRNKNFSYFNFYSGYRSAAGKLGFTYHNNFGSYLSLSKRPRRYLGRSLITSRLLAKRYCSTKYNEVYLRKLTRMRYLFSDWRTTYWGRRFRIKNWFYKNYKTTPSIFFTNPAKDNRRFAFDYVSKYFHEDDVDLSLKTFFASAPTYGGFGPLFYRSTFDFKDRHKYLRRLFIKTLFYYLNSLHVIFVLCLIFCSFPSDIQPYLF